jgi:hypothetical protein
MRKYDTLKVPKTDTMVIVQRHSYKVTNIWKDTAKLVSTDTIPSPTVNDTIIDVKRMKVSKKRSARSKMNVKK